MLNLFSTPSAKKTGSDAIYHAIGQFEAIAAQIEEGVAHNDRVIADNAATMRRLQDHSESLDADNKRGQVVAAKLRDLLS